MKRTQKNAGKAFVEKKKSSLRGYVILRMDYDVGTKGFWRQVVVPVTLNLHGLHMVILSAFNWYGYHAYIFAQGKQEYSTEEFVRECPDLGHKVVTRTGVHEIFKKVGDTADYFYDLGDNNTVRITCVGFSKGIRKSDFGTAGQDVVEDSAGLGYIPGIVKLLTKKPKTEKGLFCRDWLMEMFELSPDDVLHVPSVHEIFTRVLIVLRTMLDCCA